MLLSFSSTRDQVRRRLQELRDEIDSATEESELDELREERDELEWELERIEDEMISTRNNY